MIIWACLLHCLWPSTLGNIYSLYWGNISRLTLFFEALWTKLVQFYKVHMAQISGFFTFLQVCWLGYSLKAVQNRNGGALGGVCVCVWLRLLQALEILILYFLYSLTDIIVLVGDWSDQVIGHNSGGVQGTGWAGSQTQTHQLCSLRPLISGWNGHFSGSTHVLQRLQKLLLSSFFSAHGAGHAIAQMDAYSAVLVLCLFFTLHYKRKMIIFTLLSSYKS